MSVKNTLIFETFLNIPSRLSAQINVSNFVNTANECNPSRKLTTQHSYNKAKQTKTKQNVLYYCMSKLAKLGCMTVFKSESVAFPVAVNFYQFIHKKR